MSFKSFLNEEIENNKKIDVEEYIAILKKKGLFGYNIFKNISEEELKKIISDDNYFKKMKNGDDKSLKENYDEDGEIYLIEGAYSQSLADRLKLSRQSKNSNTNKTPPQKTAVSQAVHSTLADRLKAQRLDNQRKEAEKREKARQSLEQRLHQHDKPNTTFSNQSMKNHGEQDSNLSDRINQNHQSNTTSPSQKESTPKDKGTLKDRMFKKAQTSTDKNGYKKVNNPDDVDDSKAEKKFQASSNRNAMVQQKRMTQNEYSKRTLCAIGDRMDNFRIYCKFRKKTNNQMRTGNFKILPTTSQVTNKQDTIVVQDLDLSKKENKVVYRSLNLSAIYQMKPL